MPPEPLREYAKGESLTSTLLPLPGFRDLCCLVQKLSNYLQPACPQWHVRSVIPLASLQTWLQYLSLSTLQVQLAWAHFLGSGDMAIPPVHFVGCQEEV